MICDNIIQSTTFMRIPNTCTKQISWESTDYLNREIKTVYALHSIRMKKTANVLFETKKMQMFLFWRKKKKSNIPFLQETETHFLSLCVYAYFVRSSCQLRLWIRQKFIWYNMVISIYILLCIAFTWLLSSVWMLFVCLCELNDYSSYSGSRMYSRYKCTTTE